MSFDKYFTQINVGAVDSIFDQLKELHHQRNQQYQTGFVNHGAVLMALFPHGVRLNNVEDMMRFAMLNNLVMKLVRYTTSWPIPHSDSLLDMAVYAVLLENLDKELHICQQP